MIYYCCYATSKILDTFSYSFLSKLFFTEWYCNVTWDVSISWRHWESRAA